MLNLILIGIVAFVLYRIFQSYKRFQQIYYSRERFQNMKVSKEAISSSELGLFVALCAKVAKADGRIDELEAELIGNMFNDISKVLSRTPQSQRVFKRDLLRREAASPQCRQPGLATLCPYSQRQGKTSDDDGLFDQYRLYRRKGDKR